MLCLNMCNALKRIKKQKVKRNHFPMRFMSSKMCTLQNQSHKISKCFCSVKIEKKLRIFFLSQKMQRSKTMYIRILKAINHFFFLEKTQKKRNLFYIYHFFETKKNISPKQKVFLKKFLHSPFRLIHMHLL